MRGEGFMNETNTVVPKLSVSLLIFKNFSALAAYKEDHLGDSNEHESRWQLSFFK